MKDSSRSSEASSQPFQGVARTGKSTTALPADFVPLRLVLLPTGASVELNQTEAVLGRHSDADIRVPLPDVSRRHCRFLFADGQWQVVDLNSLNGIFVNEKRVQRAVLRQRDTLRVGGFTFEVDLQARVRTMPVPPSSSGSPGQEQRRAS